MAFVSVSTWKWKEGVDEEELRENARQKFNYLKTLGVTRQMSVRISDNESMIVSEWPSLAAREAAMEKVMAMRSDIKDEGMVELSGEMMGEVEFEV